MTCKNEWSKEYYYWWYGSHGHDSWTSGMAGKKWVKEELTSRSCLTIPLYPFDKLYDWAHGNGPLEVEPKGLWLGQVKNTMQVGHGGRVKSLPMLLPLSPSLNK